MIDVKKAATIGHCRAFSRSSFLAALFFAACSQPDNYVYGGVNGHDAIPAAQLPNIRTALFGERETANGRERIVVMSDTDHLCAKLDANPHFFSQPSVGLVALILRTPAGRIGTFNVNADAGATLEVSGGPGSGSATYNAGSGLVYVGEADAKTGSQASGNFSQVILLSTDGSGTAVGQMDGAFVADYCAPVAKLP